MPTPSTENFAQSQKSDENKMNENVTHSLPATPIKIEPHNLAEIAITWNRSDWPSPRLFTLSYIELRFHCPCAACVDEHTGRRTLQRDQVATTVRPTSVELVGRYAVQISWSDGHATGIYHFDRLFELCRQLGKEMNR